MNAVTQTTQMPFFGLAMSMRMVESVLLISCSVCAKESVTHFEDEVYTFEI